MDFITPPTMDDPKMKLVMLAKKAGASEETCKMLAKDLGVKYGEDEEPEMEDEEASYDMEDDGSMVHNKNPMKMVIIKKA